MLTRVSLVLLALIAPGTVGQVAASPITYAFTGTLQQSYNGSNQFSGSFTINGDPTVEHKYPGYRGYYDNYGSVTEGGSDVSMTLKLNGQDQFTFTNKPYGSPEAFFNAGLSQSWISNPLSSPYNETTIVGLGGSNLGGGAFASFGLDFDNSTTIPLTNLRDLSFPLGQEDASVSYASGTFSFASNGSIDSISLVPTPIPAPEPSTLAVFAVLGATAMVFRHRLRR